MKHREAVGIQLDVSPGSVDLHCARCEAGFWFKAVTEIAFLPKASELASDRRQELEDKARATLAQVIGGTFFLLTGFFQEARFVKIGHKRVRRSI